jgi:hypothetical protein
VDENDKEGNLLQIDKARVLILAYETARVALVTYCFSSFSYGDTMQETGSKRRLSPSHFKYIRANRGN